MSRELQAAAKAFRAALTEDAAVAALAGTRIYEGLAPQGTALPYVLFSYHTGGDVQAQGSAGRILTRPVYLVKALTEGTDFGPADTLAAAVDGVVEDLDSLISIGSETYRVQVQGRLEPVRYLETVAGGSRYYHAGGLYRLIVDLQ